ncbi:MAG: type II secretion system secretin GspD, partial [Methylococcales bacterium]
FDTNVLKGRSFALFSLVHVEPETVIKELEAVFNDKTGDKDGFFRFIPIERLNAILAITHQARYLSDIESWVFRLDKANTASGGSFNVYRVQNVDAVELADTLNEVFNGTQKKTKSASVAPGQQAAEISSSTPDTQPPPTDTKPLSTSGSGATGDATVSGIGEVKIIADEPNNSLVIVATAQQYERILPIINQLDVMPLQVLIDATIVEVDLKDDLKYGLQWSFNNGNFLNLLTQAGPDVLNTVSSGYSLFYSGGTAKAVLNALATKSTINVIASPSIMVLNNQEASINVGDKVPIATSQSTNTNSANVTPNLLTPNTTSAIVSNNIQMLDTGITLKIKPRVNAGGLVLMKIEQEANQAVRTTTSGLDSPTIQQRKIHSSIAVKNGETIVLGGLIREDNGRGITGMPLLMDIPILGSLFGTTSKNKDKTELVILITPRVVGNEQNARDVTNEFKRKLTGIYQDSPNESKSHY